MGCIVPIIVPSEDWPVCKFHQQVYQNWKVIVGYFKEDLRADQKKGHLFCTAACVNFAFLPFSTLLNSFTIPSKVTGWVGPKTHGSMVQWEQCQWFQIVRCWMRDTFKLTSSDRRSNPCQRVQRFDTLISVPPPPVTGSRLVKLPSFLKAFSRI